MRRLLDRRVPAWALLALVLAQVTATYGAVTVLYHSELAAYGTLRFTGEAEVVGFDVHDEAHHLRLPREPQGPVSG